MSGMSGPAAGAQTPMMAQYHGLKAEAPDCLLFYRMGDFFELFFEDAKVAAACLDIALTSRGDGAPMCGVPVHAADAYLARLIRAGHRVAVAEQVETPDQAKKARGSKALVARKIIRLVTAGTLTEETLLDSRSANWLVAIAERGARIGLAAADISTGRFELASVPAASLDAELARLGPSEVVIAEGGEGPADPPHSPARVQAVHPTRIWVAQQALLGGGRHHMGFAGASAATSTPLCRAALHAGAGRRAHARQAAQAAEGGGVDGGHAAVHVGVVHGGDGVPLGAAHQVLLDRADGAQVRHVPVLHRLQRHVLGAHLLPGCTCLGAWLLSGAAAIVQNASLQFTHQWP